MWETGFFAVHNWCTSCHVSLYFFPKQRSFYSLSTHLSIHNSSISLSSVRVLEICELPLNHFSAIFSTTLPQRWSYAWSSSPRGSPTTRNSTRLVCRTLPASDGHCWSPCVCERYLECLWWLCPWVLALWSAFPFRFAANLRTDKQFPSVHCILREVPKLSTVRWIFFVVYIVSHREKKKKKKNRMFWLLFIGTSEWLFKICLTFPLRVITGAFMSTIPKHNTQKMNLSKTIWKLLYLCMLW